MPISPATSSSLNLASRPFRNQQPLFRVAVLLWVGMAILLIFNAITLWRHVTGSSAGQEDLAGLRAQIEAEEQRSQQLQERLGSFDLEAQNEQAEFLNHKIAERAFPWGRLFEQIGEVLPIGVRLTSLTPIVRDPENQPRTQRRRTTASSLEMVDLEIRAQARSDDDILELLDVLYRHPAFVGPVLHNESQEDSGYTVFNLSVAYLPGVDATTSDETGPTDDEDEPAAEPESLLTSDAGDGAMTEGGEASPGTSGPLGSSPGDAGFGSASAEEDAR